MKKFLTLLTIIFVTCLPLSTYANEAIELPDSFIKKLIQGKIEEATDQYFETNPLIGSKQQQVEYVKTQIEGGLKVFGKPFAYELAIEEQISKSLKRFVYISKHEYHILTWEFYIYKPKNTWIASNMTFNDKFNLLESKK